MFKLKKYDSIFSRNNIRKKNALSCQIFLLETNQKLEWALYPLRERDSVSLDKKVEQGKDVYGLWDKREVDTASQSERVWGGGADLDDKIAK